MASVFAVELGEVGDGAEDFFTGGDVFERAFHEGGLYVVAGFAGDFSRAALDDHLRAFFDALFEIAEDAFALLLVDDRAHLRGSVHLVADVHLLD